MLVRDYVQILRLPWLNFLFMVGLEDFVLDMKDEERDILWERALLPFPSGNEIESLLEYIDPEEPESNRVRVSNQLNGQTDTLPLDLGYPVIDLAVNQTPFETIGLKQEDVETVLVDKQERVKTRESVLKALKMIPTSEASQVTDAVKGTVKRWRSGGSQTVPLEFWENYVNQIEEKTKKLDVSDFEADLVDFNKYYYGGNSIPESTVIEDVPLPRVARIGHLLDSGNFLGEVEDLYDSTENTGLNNIENYLLNEFIQGTESEFFQIFQENKSFFGRQFSGMLPYKRQETEGLDLGEKEYVEKWYDVLEELGNSTSEGVFLGPSRIGEISDIIKKYELDNYGYPA